MEKRTSIYVPIETEKDRFKNHLNHDYNHRIIFSGKFGSGKTYFLDNYFSTYEPDYETFFISPIHYGISKNEDIFEYIKYDVLINLLSKDIRYEKIKYSDPFIAQFFIEENFWRISKDIIKHVGKVGKIVSTVMNDLEKHKNNYGQFKSEVNSDTENNAKSFLKQFEVKTGSIFENNDTTELINSLLSSINKKKVLIIDDLDRMDPDHIFRILNIFAAQFSDDKNEYWKFDFDKIIIVCDLNNIRNLFRHKYGQGVDFSGYIDKFYSLEPFIFDNKKAIIDVLHLYLGSIKKEEHDENFKRHFPLINILIKYDVINLRKMVERSYTRWDHPFRKYRHSFNQYPPHTIILIDFLLFMYSNSKDDLCHVIDKINDEVDYKHGDFKCFEDLCPLLHIISGSSQNDNQYLIFADLSLDIRIEYEIKDNLNYNKIANITKISNYENTQERDKVPFFKLLKICIENYHIMQQRQSFFYVYN